MHLLVRLGRLRGGHGVNWSEGRIHFAGEHASLHHAWVQGAIDSGLRAAAEVYARSFRE